MMEHRMFFCHIEDAPKSMIDSDGDLVQNVAAHCVLVVEARVPMMEGENVAAALMRLIASVREWIEIMAVRRS